LATGAQGLKVATIYNSTKLSLQGDLKHLIIAKGNKKAQYGIVQHFKKNESSEEFLSINVHLNGGKTEKDQNVRLDQLKNLVDEMQLEPFSNVSNRVITGDFNTDISEVEGILKDKLQMTYAFEGEKPYDSENRLQYRNRDGHVGMDVIIRCIDGVFIAGNFDFSSKLVKDDENFDKMTNIEGLKSFETRVKEHKKN
jgi:hypothetical protein